MTELGVRVSGLQIKKLTKKQRVAIRLLAKGNTPRKVSEVLSVKIGTLTRWLTDNEKFQTILAKRLSESTDKDAEYRKRNNIHFLEKVYNTIHDKLKNGMELESMDLRDLISMSKVLASEIRADTPKVVEENSHNGIQLNVKELQLRFERATMPEPKELSQVIDVTPE